MLTTNGEQINVLLIEDNPTDARLIKELLRDAPHERFTVITASTLTKGLRKLARNNVSALEAKESNEVCDPFSIYGFPKPTSR